MRPASKPVNDVILGRVSNTVTGKATLASNAVIPACPESFFVFKRIPDALCSLKAPTSGAGMTNHGTLHRALFVMGLHEG